MNDNPLMRCVRHLWTDQHHVRRTLGPSALERLENHVRQSEARHTGELRLCVEGGMPWPALWRGETPRQRAVDTFSALRVWDTEANNGILIYLLMAEHDIEIVADRGIAQRVPESAWQDITQRLSDTLRQGQYEQGLLAAIDAVEALLVLHYPADPALGNPNQLPDQVVVI